LRSSFQDCEPLAAFVGLGSEALGAVASVLGEGLGEVEADGEPSLEEDSVLATLLRTHAPSDTTVVALGLNLRASEAFVPAHVYLLVEPKLFSGLLASVAHP
jgi:hypothetical protein